jgi:hypothetical protein
MINGYDLNTDRGYSLFMLTLPDNTIAQLLVNVELEVRRMCSEALFVRITDKHDTVTHCTVCKLPLRINARYQFSTKLQFVPQIVGKVFEYVEEKLSERSKMIIQLDAWRSAYHQLSALEIVK